MELSGIEPLTSCVQNRCSTFWAIAPLKIFISKIGLSGFEPPTSPLSRVCSNHLSYKPIKNYSKKTIVNTCFFKEVIQPQVPLRLPCYDFTPVMNHKVVGAFLNRLSYLLLLQPTPMVWRAVCTRPENVFTATCWFAITSDSYFMESSCRLQSGLWRTFLVWLALTSSLLSVYAIVARV